MKTILTTVLFLFSILSNINAQTDSQKLDSLKKAITKINPAVDFNDKLVFISVWKSTDAESREINKEAYRVYKIYERAKLKDGEKGTVFISLNLDSDEQVRTFAIGKDSIDSSVVYADANLIECIQSAFNSSNPKNNIVLNKIGSVQYFNISKDQIFPSLRNLITR